MTIAKTEIRSKQDQVQFLRFLAFLNVFALHAGSWCVVDYPLWNAGVSAVTFFFMLSGILTGYNAYGKSAELSLGAVGKDIWKKIQKVYPLFFMVTAYRTFSTTLLSEFIHRGDSFLENFGRFVRVLFLVQSWFPDGYFSYNGSGWYLSTLMFLCLFNLPMVRLLNTIAKKKRCHEIFLVLISVLVLLTVGYSYITYTDMAHFLQYVFPPARMGQYFVAMIVGFMIRLKKERSNENDIPVALCSVLEAVSLIFWVVTLYWATENWSNRLVFWMLPNVFVLGVFLLGKGKVSTLFRLKPLVALGNISFECYLLNSAVIKLLQNVQPITKADNIICFMSALCYTILLAFFLQKKSYRRI